ncbi:MAG: HipA domain-containing protein [Gammaproteobacteria bacterium]|nr:HipA domain-containing protein [Gammaproteobacteria bacterium]
MTNGSNYILDVIIGSQRKIATITMRVGSETEISLIYQPAWIEQGFPISPHLPLNGKFDFRAVRNYLQNLLPEGKGLEDITSNTTISKNNTFGLIRVIGQETSGALSFKAPDQLPKPTHLRVVTDNELTDKLARFCNIGESITYWDGRTRLSVAGVQDKLNFLEYDGKIGFGEGNLCSNKIFKFETGKAPLIAVNEFFTMMLARHSGIDVPKVEIRAYGGVRTFVIERFDRRLLADKSSVQCRHVIDGCQATNLPPSYKYERQHGDEGDGIYMRDGVSFSHLFAVKTSNDAAYRLKLIQWMTFNILTRNYDAHGKNISFFVGSKGLELTPFYDLVNIEAIIQEIKRRSQASDSTEPDSSIPQNYAMSIGEYEQGSEGNFKNSITAFMLADFANSFEISLPRIELVMTQVTQSVLKSLATCRQETLNHDLSAAEIKHVDLCITIVTGAAEELLTEIKQITDMKELF